MAKRKRLSEKQIAAIELLADFGQHLTYEEIAKRVGVDVSTLRRSPHVTSAC